MSEKRHRCFIRNEEGKEKSGKSSIDIVFAGLKWPSALIRRYAMIGLKISVMQEWKTRLVGRV